MKKKVLYFIAITLCACGNSELENNVVQDSQQDLSSPELAYNESIGDSILPYFEFDEQGNKI